MKLLLHCCCAPCSISCVSNLRSEGIETELFWFNPNIHPVTEYAFRRDCISQFAANENLQLKILNEYSLGSFLDAVTGSTEKRCEVCYKMRLEKTASAAARDGFNAFSTTLLISPYQDHDAIKRIGEKAGKKYGVDFLYRDFRPLFREGQTQARAAGMYMQKYCGCVFSADERGSSK